MSYEIVKVKNENGKMDAMPCRFGMNSLRIFTKMSGIELMEIEKIGENMDLDMAIQLAWCGLKDGHRKAGKDFDLSVDDVADMLDYDMDSLTKIMDVFANQFNAMVPNKSGNDTGAASPKKAKK
jgi:hypothetical protein